MESLASGEYFGAVAIAAIVGYLLGSIPFGLVITRIAGLGDIRSIGSGNIGATNVLRTGRRDLALATLLLDAGKAGLAYWVVVFAVGVYA
ncbi:MAG TPA: glycerol-3-phosphate acyltransferase, partial [Hyphomonadaceae bacterium]